MDAVIVLECIPNLECEDVTACELRVPRPARLQNRRGVCADVLALGPGWCLSYHSYV